MNSKSYKHGTQGTCRVAKLRVAQARRKMQKGTAFFKRLRRTATLSWLGVLFQEGGLPPDVSVVLARNKKNGRVPGVSCVY